MAKENKPAETASPDKSAEKRAKFVELATARVGKSLAQIRGVGKLANPKAYSFTADDATKIVAAIRGEADRLEKRFTDALAGNVAVDKSDFSL